MTISAEDIPRVWIRDFSVRQATDSAGRRTIRVKARAHIHGLAQKDIRLEATLLTADCKEVAVRDPRYRVTGNRAGNSVRLRVTKTMQSHDVDLSIPLAALVLKSGRHRLLVHLRALRADGHYIGGTAGMALVVTVP